MRGDPLRRLHRRQMPDPIKDHQFRLRGERRQEAQNRFQSELLRDAEIRIIPREPSQP